MNSEKSVRRLIGLKISCNFSWDFFSKFSGILGFRIEKFGEFFEISLEISRDFADYFEISTNLYGNWNFLFFAERTKTFGVIYLSYISISCPFKFCF